MSIEKDIHQNRKFRNNHHKAIVNIIFTHSWLKEHLQQLFAREELTMQQYNILRILKGSNAPISTLEIRDRMLDKMSDTSRIVDRLLVKGLVKKRANNGDKRLVDVSITEKGLKTLLKLDVYSVEMDRIVKNLNEKEAAVLNKLLDKLRISD
jgi:DNA-binding MarR family transcriptional regulator